ncbi:RES domain-containing protein [Flammeovirga yaeyamensis]|uniref:RES domain-containing protein n=1 Tax=Flammeovirga yaeyamensis TaxID=367791 RepID=A0AAX1NCB2_9BACT|nr:RES family NAD+ phosphorylase [Flammeovirga yaeyamensis]MBB3696973.1 RES domain-containing protein [Flammeovirga yaeyamensis]NMF33636.1 RES family NAD+ phosphorylase [Flammeovirga yaeyamensis]QWG05097.1 RES domain-containing protein [Flammeovirga yaeyamensis]
MKVYRIEREKYLKSTLKGIGAALTDGYRWNSLNTFLVYTAETRALATLEVSVHLDLNEDLPTDRYYVEIEIPDDIKILEIDIEDLPKDWDSRPPILETQFIGDDFVFDGQAAVLKVPSCIVPQEFNYLINPNHKDSSRIKVVSKVPMSFDPRIKQ